MIVYLNGQYIEESQTRILPTDRGFTLGDGIFDTMLAVDGVLQYPHEHNVRLKYHSSILKISFDLNDNAATDLLNKNGFTAGRYAIRTTVTRGPGERGLAPPPTPFPTVFMRASPAPEPPTGPVRLALSETVSRNERSPLSRIKSLGYGDNILALMEAKDKGADDALILNSRKQVACASTSNIFIEKNGKLFTPPLTDGCMNGIMRSILMKEKSAVEKSLSFNDMLDADKIFLTSSIAGIREAVLD